MYFQPTDTKELIKGKGYALREAFQVWCQLFGKPRNYSTIRDFIGKMAYEMGSVVLAAKHSQAGDTISCHKFLWDYCRNNKKKLVIYITESGYFYRFDVPEIREFVENERGGQRMVNFSLLEGKNLLKLKTEKLKVKNIVEKNKNYTLKELLKAGVFGG